MSNLGSILSEILKKSVTDEKGSVDINHSGSGDYYRMLHWLLNPKRMH